MSDDQPDTDRSASRARVRVEELTTKAKVVAGYLIANPGCFIESAALAADLLPRVHRKYMTAEGPEYEAYQRIVQPALLEHAEALLRKAEGDIACTEGGSSAWSSWHRWLLPKRHPKLFADGVQQVELSGPDGGPMQHQDVSKLSTAELKAAAKALIGADDE